MKRTFSMTERVSEILFQLMLIFTIVATPWVLWLFVKFFFEMAIVVRVLLGGFFLGSGVAALALRRSWHRPHEISLDLDMLYCRHWIRKPWEVNLKDVTIVDVNIANGGIITRVFNAGRSMVLEVSDFFDECGLLVETILSRATNVVHINDFRSDLANLDYAREAWQKEPDWDIINAAIARAEENRKKKEQQAQQENKS